MVPLSSVLAQPFYQADLNFSKLRTRLKKSHSTGLPWIFAQRSKPAILHSCSSFGREHCYSHKATVFIWWSYFLNFPSARNLTRDKRAFRALTSRELLLCSKSHWLLPYHSDRWLWCVGKAGSRRFSLYLSRHCLRPQELSMWRQECWSLSGKRGQAC